MDINGRTHHNIKGSLKKGSSFNGLTPGTAIKKSFFLSGRATKKITFFAASLTYIINSGGEESMADPHQNPGVHQSSTITLFRGSGVSWTTWIQ